MFAPGRGALRGINYDIGTDFAGFRTHTAWPRNAFRGEVQAIRDRVEDLRTFVHGPTLARVWRQLWLPRKVRTLWESRFPSLPRAA